MLKGRSGLNTFFFSFPSGIPVNIIFTALTADDDETVDNLELDLSNLGFLVAVGVWDRELLARLLNLKEGLAICV